jgi:hypothetical protein
MQPDHGTEAYRGQDNLTTSCACFRGAALVRARYRESSKGFGRNQTRPKEESSEVKTGRIGACNTDAPLNNSTWLEAEMSELSVSHSIPRSKFAGVPFPVPPPPEPPKPEPSPAAQKPSTLMDGIRNGFQFPAKGAAMKDAIITHQRNRALGKPSDSTSIRRIFNNDQIIERFGRWLLVCNKSENTRVNYILSAKQFSKFLDKPLTAATVDDVRAFLGTLYARGLAPSTIQARLDALRVLFDCLQFGSQVRFPVPRAVLRRKLPKRLPPIKTEEEIKRMITAAQTPRELALIELA